MAAGSVTQFFHLVGSLCSNPTDFTAAFPHGGTALASHARVVFALAPNRERISAEEHAGATVDYVYTADRAVLTTMLREWDSDALSAVFPNVSAGATSGRPVVTQRVYDTTTGNSSVLPGTLASAKALGVCLSPEAPNYHPAIYLPNALPLLDEAARIQADLGTEWGLALAFEAIPDASGRLYQHGLLEDLTV